MKGLIKAPLRDTGFGSFELCTYIVEENTILVGNLIRGSTVCLQNVVSKLKKNTHLTTLKMEMDWSN